jgi:hypothetical protein
MDPEIIKTATEIAKATGTAAGLSIPFTGIVKRMLGPAADELAEMWRDQVRLYRYERQLKCVQKAEKMAEDAGFTPQAVPPKILFPLLEGASFEDDDKLHDMWAALLANAASPEDAAKVRPGFIAILREMSPDEAGLFNWMLNQREGRPFNEEFSYDVLHEAYFSLGYGPNLNNVRLAPLLFNTCLNDLEAAKLIEVKTGLNSSDVRASRLLTYRGLALFEACRPPKPKENG